MAHAKKRRLDLDRPEDQEIAMQWLEEIEFDSDDNFSEVSETEDGVYEDTDSDDETEIPFGPNTICDKDYVSKNGTNWSTTPIVTSRARSENIISNKMGPTQKSKNIASIADAFYLLIDDKIVEDIVTFTNQKATIFHTANDPDNIKWRPTSATEIYAFIGLLVIMGALKATKESTKFLWSKNPLYSRTIFTASFSRDRFCQLLSFLRFDDVLTRMQRRESDKLAAIRHVFECFVDNIKQCFYPSSHLTIDEQLVAFRGKCPFKVYMKSKPARYGIKIWTMADVETSYVMNMQVYTGKEGNKPEKDQGKRVVLDLVNCLKTGYGITTDNFFTSVPLAQELLKRKLTLCGTLRKNKVDIPPALLPHASREVLSSRFAFLNHITLTSYVPKKNNAVILLSTEHHNDITSGEGDAFKPEIILHYNSTKGAVDNVDRIIAEYSCKRTTMRWPMIIFYNMINVACNNAFSLYVNKNPNWNKNKTERRRLFLLELGQQLVTPYVKERQKNKCGTHRRTLEAMEMLAGPSTEPTSEAAEQPRAKKPTYGRCYICPRKNNTTCRLSCFKCNKFVCKKHYLRTCNIECNNCTE